MSRIERNIEKVYKKRRIRFAMRILFIMVMMICTSFCLIIIDNNANVMLGNETNVYNIIKYLETITSNIKIIVNNFK